MGNPTEISGGTSEVPQHDHFLEVPRSFVTNFV